MVRNVARIISALAAVIFWLVAPAFAALAPASQPASTQPVTAGRETPAGAMMVMEHAIETGDVATVADSLNSFSDGARQAIARELVLELRFDKAMEAQFGHDALVKLCDECRMRPGQTDVKYTDDMWQISPQHPDQAVGNLQAGKTGVVTSFMQRDPDGIWRIGRYMSPEVRARATTRATAALARLGRTTLPTNPRTAQADQMSARLRRALDGLEAGKFTTPKQVEDALYPEGVPMVRARQLEQQQKQEEDQAQKQQEQAILAMHFDPSTLQGSIGAFTQAMMRGDPKGMADLLFVSGAPESSYPLASVERLIAIGDFQKAMMDHVDPKGSGLAGGFGLENDAAFAPSLAWDQPREHGDVGMISRGGNGEVAAWYRKVGGVWKQEIKLDVHPPQTLARYTKDVQDDTAALQRIIADVNSGKLMTVDQVRDALGNAGLNCFSDPTFTMEFQPDPQSPSQDHPKNPPIPTAPTTPAGAMNRFIRAVQSGDETAVRDCLWLPNDQNGAAAATMAHDYVAGARFARALQKDAPGWNNVDGYCVGAGAIPPESLRDYSEDEWTPDVQHPDIAVSNNAIFARPDPPQQGRDRPSFTMVRQWAPIMHRGPDGIWRLGPWYPQSAQQLKKQTLMLAAKDTVLVQATAELDADKVRTIDDLSNEIFPKLKQIGASPVTTFSQ